ncbi:MAG: thymidine phosphorylase [Clostridia bacterium]|nr:thymidine phosphorylase [Clostridia bacterium]
MLMTSLLTKKKLGQELTREEICFFVKGAADGTIPDYQLTAMLMAIRLNGMTARETVDLTLAMRDSGDIADLSAIPGIKVDKHSTGGVGDTVTLVAAPMVAACGVPVAKMSGRGLGHTGGTLDKLESIPGMSISLTEDAFIRQVKETGLAVIGQTGSLAPADKTLYALRDVTSTVDSLPLIVSSILSKKLASGSDGIVLDVKTGSGAIMHTVEDSIELARTMVEIGTMAGKKFAAIVTDMGQPLGTHVGNALEVKDAIDVLSGRTGGDLKEISLIIGALMLKLGGKAGSMEEGRAMLEKTIENGTALEKLRLMIAAQGGDPRVCDDVTLLPRPAVIRQAVCGRAGWVSAMNTEALGEAGRAMGAGRLELTDVIDPAVGFVLHPRIGDRVEEDTPLCTLYAKNEADADRAEEAVRAAITFSDEPCGRMPLYYAIITENGMIRPE